MHGAKVHGEGVLEQVQRTQQQRMQPMLSDLYIKPKKPLRREQAGHQAHAGE
jgi:hypothetical protein